MLQGSIAAAGLLQPIAVALASTFGSDVWRAGLNASRKARLAEFNLPAMPFLGDQRGVSPYAAGKPARLTGLRRAAQTSLQRFDAKLLEAPTYGRPARWTLSPLTTSCCSRPTKCEHSFETVGCCWMGQLWNFRALNARAMGLVREEIGIDHWLLAEAGTAVMQRMVEHRRMKKFARGNPWQ